MDTLASPYTSWSNLELILDLVWYKIHFSFFSFLFFFFSFFFFFLVLGR